MSFSTKIISWYSENKRDLPWRKTTNPYYIWLSEIILQQTRINQGMEYYFNFIQQYPTVSVLANASEENILKTWQGLGYYSRARNLHTAAQTIANEFNGIFPDTYKDILKLKGVGKYTAAAIASFAFKLPYPVIDGNVYRLIARLYGIYTPINSSTAYSEFEFLLNNLIDKSNPDTFNQAIMDFGSIYCKPQKPNCIDCIFVNECVAFKANKVSELPIKHKIKKIKNRYFYYLDIRWKTNEDTQTLLQLRKNKDIWKNLYEFPLLEFERPLSDKEIIEHTFPFLQSIGTNPQVNTIIPSSPHKLSHQTIFTTFIVIQLESIFTKTKENFTITSRKDLNLFPVSRLIDKYLKNN